MLRSAIRGLLCCACLAVGLSANLRGDPSPAPAATAVPTIPPVREIVQKAVARDNARRERRLAYQCDQTILTQTMDTNGMILKSKAVHLIYRQTADISFSTNVQSNSAKPDEDTVKAQHIMAVMDLGKLAPHFIETVIGSATVQGRDCYVVGYRPKGGQPADTREEKVVNNVAGRFWIAKDNFDILQSEGSLVSPVTVALIASVTRMDFKFHSQPIANGDIGPADFSVDMAIHAPFYDFRQLQVNTQANWRLAH